MFAARETISARRQLYFSRRDASGPVITNIPRSIPREARMNPVYQISVPDVDETITSDFPEYTKFLEVSGRNFAVSNESRAETFLDFLRSQLIFPVTRDTLRLRRLFSRFIAPYRTACITKVSV